MPDPAATLAAHVVNTRYEDIPAESRAATARGVFADAHAEWFTADEKLQREFLRLRRAAVAPWRLKRAFKQLEDAYEAFHADRSNWPVGSKVLPAFFAAQSTLGLYRDGCEDPPTVEELDRLVANTLAALKQDTADALSKHQVLVDEVHKKERTRRLLNP